MAGSYLHLHLATGSFQAAFGGPSEDRPAEHAAFLAGSLAPDLGFFPGGPVAFSRRVHHEHTADLVRSLLVAAADSVERAFAAGWALHVCTDVATHPIVNRHADILRRDRGSQPESRLDLWHKRLEWGLDCHVLTVVDPRPLWRSELIFPAGLGSCLLARAAKERFGQDAHDNALRAGWGATHRWISRLAPIFSWTGSCRSPSRGRLASVAGPVLRPLARAVGHGLQDLVSLEDEVAILSPVPPAPAFVQQMMSAGAGAVAAFQTSWSESFVHLPNLDLDTGKPILDPAP